MRSKTHERADPANFLRIAPDVRLAKDVVLHAFVNLYGCEIGAETRIGTFVEIQKNAQVGARCKIQSHTFICEGVTIEDEVFVGHGVMFINDHDPSATTAGRLQTVADWRPMPTRVCRAHRSAAGLSSWGESQSGRARSSAQVQSSRATSSRVPWSRACRHGSYAGAINRAPSPDRSVVIHGC